MDVKAFNESGKGYWMEGFGILRAEGENRPSRPSHIICFAWANSGKAGLSADNTAPTVKAIHCGEPAVVCASFMGGQGANARSIAYCDDGTTPTLKATPSGSNMTPDVVICLQGGGTTSSGHQGGNGWNDSGIAYTVNTVDVHGICYGISRSMLKGGMNAGGMPVEEQIQPSITAQGAAAVCYKPEETAHRGGVATSMRHCHKPAKRRENRRINLSDDMRKSRNRR